MDIYDIDFALQTRNLIHPDRRTPKTLDFIGAITDSLQDLRNLIFDDYKKGSSHLAYNNGATYSKYDRVKWTDMGIYELIVPTSTGVDPTGEALSETNWVKVLDYFVGTDRRLQYNSQLIVLMTAINEWFAVSSSPYIYIVNNNIAGIGFVLHVPAAVYAALGSTNTIRNARIDKFVSKFVAAGLTYDIVTY